MASYSVADAKNRLSELIDRAVSGEDVVITRHGAPMVGLKPVTQNHRPVSDEEIEWLRRHRVKGKPPAEDAGTTVSRMRDEEWQR